MSDTLGLAGTAAILFLLPLPAPSPAQTWAPVGPPGGDVRALAADPRSPHVVYLGTADGVLYRSEDSGRTWRRLEPGFPRRGMSLDEIVVDARGRVLVGYWEVAGKGGGVGRSEDGGRTVNLLEGVAGQSVRALAVAPSNPDVLVAGALAGVFRSDDGGGSWRRISPEGHAGIRNVESVAVDPSDSDLIYAGTWHLPWKTVDGGGTWLPVNAGMIADSEVFTLRLDPKDPRTIYATACTGIYRSRDWGASWRKIPGIPASSRRTRAFAQDPARPETFYAGTTEGLWASHDGAATWRLLTPKRLVVNAVAALPGGTVILGCDGAGVLRSDDRGQTWSASNDRFSHRFVSRVVFDGAGRILAGIRGDRHHGGVVSAERPAGPWVRLGAGLEGREVLSLALAGPEVLAGTDDGLFLFLSASHGGTWTRLPTRANGLDLHPRVVDVAAVSDRVLLAATTRGLLRSADRGRAWELRSLGAGSAVSALTVSSREAGLVLAATPLGVFRSHDGGVAWEQVSMSLAEASIHRLAFLPGDDRVVFATTLRGLFQSADQGRTWRRCGGGLPPSDITGLALHPDGRTLWASDFTGGGIYRSDDAGETWRPIPTDGLASDRVWGLALDPAAPSTLLASTPAGGLHVLSAVAGAAAGSP